MPTPDTEITKMVSEIVARVDEQLEIIRAVEKALEELRERRRSNGVVGEWS